MPTAASSCTAVAPRNRENSASKRTVMSGRPISPAKTAAPSALPQPGTPWNKRRRRGDTPNRSRRPRERFSEMTRSRRSRTSGRRTMSRSLSSRCPPSKMSASSRHRRRARHPAGARSGTAQRRRVFARPRRRPRPGRSRASSARSARPRSSKGPACSNPSQGSGRPASRCRAPS